MLDPRKPQSICSWLPKIEFLTSWGPLLCQETSAVCQGRISFLLWWVWASGAYSRSFFLYSHSTYWDSPCPEGRPWPYKKPGSWSLTRYSRKCHCCTTYAMPGPILHHAGVSMSFSKGSCHVCSIELSDLMTGLAGFPFGNLEGLTVNQNQAPFRSVFVFKEDFPRMWNPLFFL